VRSAVRSIIPVLGPVMLLLCGCASDSTFTMAGRQPDPAAFEADASQCSRAGGPFLDRVFETTVTTAGQGAYEGGESGGPLGAAGGAAIGSVWGFIVGITDTGEDNYDLCMVRKGYQLVDSEAVPEPIPDVAR
jgi:hypothetical protein